MDWICHKVKSCLIWIIPKSFKILEQPGDRSKGLLYMIASRKKNLLFVWRSFQLIHEADHSPVVITIFTQSVRKYVPKLSNQATITAGRDCGLAEWIIDDSCLVLRIFVCTWKNRSSIPPLPPSSCQVNKNQSKYQSLSAKMGLFHRSTALPNWFG